MMASVFLLILVLVATAVVGGSLALFFRYLRGANARDTDADDPHGTADRHHDPEGKKDA